MLLTYPVCHQARNYFLLHFLFSFGTYNLFYRQRRLRYHICRRCVSSNSTLQSCLFRSCGMRHSWSHHGGYPSSKILVSSSGNNFRGTYMCFQIDQMVRTISRSASALRYFLPQSCFTRKTDVTIHLCIFVLSLFIRGEMNLLC